MARQTKEPKSAFDALSDQHKAFVVAYLRTFNARKAAIEAGYGEAGAGVRAWELRNDPKVAAAISEQLDRIGITEERIKSEFAELALDSDVADFEDVLVAGLKLKDARKLGLPTKRIKKLRIKRRVVRDPTGDAGDTYEIEDVELELHDPQRALESLAKIRAMFTEKRELSGTVQIDATQEQIERACDQVIDRLSARSGG